MGLVASAQWEFAYLFWSWRQEGDPMAPVFDRFAEYGNNGFELVGVVSHSSIRGSGAGGAMSIYTEGCWFVATFKRPVPG